MAIAVFHWTPRDFWQSTPYEFFAALDIQIEISGGSNQDSEWEDWYNITINSVKG